MFCSKCRFDGGKTVREAKVVRFFQDKVLKRSHRIRKPTSSDNENDYEDKVTRTLSYNTLVGNKRVLRKIKFQVRNSSCLNIIIN